MKNETTPAPAPAPATPPVFDEKTAKPVTQYRHKETGRTVGNHQPAGEDTHLFSATGVFIAAVKNAAAEQLAADAAAAAEKTNADETAAAEAAHKFAMLSPAEKAEALKAKATARSK
jgi:hypothetical protein